MLNQVDSILHNLGIRPVFDRYYAPTAKKIEKIEKTIQQKLPQEYKSFVSQYGVATFHDPASVYLKPKKEYLPIQTFLGGGKLVYPTDIYGEKSGEKHRVFDLVDEIKQLKAKYNKIPGELFPIAVDDLGNYFCIGVGSANSGKVFYLKCNIQETEISAQELAQLTKPFFKPEKLIAEDLQGFFKLIIIDVH